MHDSLKSDLRWADARILIIDDDPSNARLLSRILVRAGYRDVHMMTDGRRAMAAYGELEPALVLLDLRMPHVSGFSLLQRLREVADPANVTPVLVVTADPSVESRRRAHLLGANDYLVKPYDLAEVIRRVDALLELRAHANAGYSAMHEMRNTLDLALRHEDTTECEVLERLIVACSFRDSMSEGHTRRVGELAAAIASQLQLSAETVESIRYCAQLHDVGKIAVPDEILLKPGRLTPDEMSVAQHHTTIGAAMLSGTTFPLLQLAAEIAVTHHERWDGNGYPHGLSGAAIPMAGRVVAVADVFDALTHERPYKKAWPVGDALCEIRANRGSQFDPDVVDALFSLVSTDFMATSTHRTAAAA